MAEEIHEDVSDCVREGLLLVEVLSEGPHCVPCQYAIATVESVSQFYQGRIEFRVVETKKPEDAVRYLDLCRKNGGQVPVPGIVIADKLVFDQIPRSEDLCRAIDAALLEWESGD